jgi:CRP/FNR family transcriptional regulator
VSDQSRCQPTIYEDLVQGERELSQMFGSSPSMVFPAGAILIDPVRPSRSFYALRRGWASRTSAGPDGRRVIREIYVPGDLIGFGSALRTRPTAEVVALQPVTLQAVDVGVVSGLLAQRTTATYLAWLIGEAQRRAGARADWLVRFNAQERLAEMLADLHERLRHRELVTHGSFHLPMTQQQIADHLGLTVVHLNRTLRLLREEQIAIVDRKVVTVHNMERLRRLARRHEAGPLN